MALRCTNFCQKLPISAYTKKTYRPEAATVVSMLVFFGVSFFLCLCAFCGWFPSHFQASNDLQQVFFFCREYRSKIENHSALFNSDNHWRIRTAKTLFQSH